MDTLEAFVNDVLDGKVEAYLKSEPVPESQDAVKVGLANHTYTDHTNLILKSVPRPREGHISFLNVHNMKEI